jgi:uncharacterized protein involved in exopolysaccharide biosynthesis
VPLSLLLAGLRRRWRKLLVATLLLWTAGAAVLFSMPRAYVARAVVAPAETTAFAVSAFLAPIPFPTAALLDTRPSGNFAIYLAALRSAEAAAMLLRETGIGAALADRRPGLLVALFGPPRAIDADDVLDWLTRTLAVTPSLASVTWTIEVSDPDPALALAVLERLHAFAEAKVRADLAGQAARRIAALEERIKQETDVFLRNTLYDLLGQHQRAGLVVEADESVAARLVSAPTVEARPSLPNLPLLLALLAIAAPLGVLLAGIALILLREEALAPAGTAPADPGAVLAMPLAPRPRRRASRAGAAGSHLLPPPEDGP